MEAVNLFAQQHDVGKTFYWFNDSVMFTTSPYKRASFVKKIKSYSIDAQLFIY